MTAAGLSGLSLWVTRPDPENQRSVAFWQSRGGNALSVPLLAVERLEIPASVISELENSPPTQLAFTSGRAIENLLANLSEHPKLVAQLCALPAWTVGGRTSDAARAAGFQDVRENPGKTAKELADHMSQQLNRSDSVFFAAARQRRDELPQRLAAVGIGLRECAVYDTVELPLSNPSRVESLRSERPPLLLAYSPTAVRAIRATLAPIGVAAPVATLGPTTTAAAEASGLDVVAASVMPSEEALCESVSNWWAEEARRRA